MEDEEEARQPGPPFYDGYVLLYGPNQSDIETIVRGRPATRPGYMLEDSKYRAFFGLWGKDWEHFDRKVARIIGNRDVERDVFKMWPVPRALRPCPIKRSALSSDECLAIGLANVNSLNEADIDRAVQRINALRMGDDPHVADAARVDVGVVPILVEVQKPPQHLLGACDAVNGVEGVQCHFMSGHLLGVDPNPDCPKIKVV